MKGLFQCPPRFIGYTELFVFAGYHLCYLYKSNTMLKHTAVVRPSGWRRKASKERCLKDSYTIRNHLSSFFGITYYSCNAKILTCTKILYRLWR